MCCTRQSEAAPPYLIGCRVSAIKFRALARAPCFRCTSTEKGSRWERFKWRSMNPCGFYRFLLFSVWTNILCDTSFDYSTRYNARQSAGESKERSEGLYMSTSAVQYKFIADLFRRILATRGVNQSTPINPSENRVPVRLVKPSPRPRPSRQHGACCGERKLCGYFDISLCMCAARPDSHHTLDYLTRTAGLQSRTSLFGASTCPFRLCKRWGDASRKKAVARPRLFFAVYR